jgi:hypothetical protein
MNRLRSRHFLQPIMMQGRRARIPREQQTQTKGASRGLRVAHFGNEKIFVDSGRARDPGLIEASSKVAFLRIAPGDSR